MDIVKALLANAKEVLVKKLSWLERGANNAKVTGSTPVVSIHFAFCSPSAEFKAPSVDAAAISGRYSVCDYVFVGQAQ
ncbi:hypothetical protein [Absidia glauca]|uniref:Uncharacterized protein n=1 Tax=Absidia glauca TaxID=4829 RepID=A0A168NLH1_ABSGL|nr:hypothetical protein [Absidia glauca]